MTGDSVEYRPYQEAIEDHQELNVEECRQGVQWLPVDGIRTKNAEAVFNLLATVPGWRWMRSLYRSVPGLRATTEDVYRWVAKNRTLAWHGTRVVWGRDFEGSTWNVSRFLFLRFLAVVWLIAFASYGVQMEGLFGSNGVLPVEEYFQHVREGPGSKGWLQTPGLMWASPTFGFLQMLVVTGILASLLLLAGILELPMLLLLWATYLSVVVAGQTFYSFQWDSLLIETGFLAIFLTPLRLVLRPGREKPVFLPALWLMWILLAKLMFLSGATKLTWDSNGAWRNLTALMVHYQTQPIPNPLSWYAHHLPEWFQKASCIAMYLIEIGLPFLVFAPRRIRFMAGAGFVLLMILISLTGNYTFFNLLVIVLCVLLFDDQAWLSLIPERLRSRISSPRTRRRCHGSRRIAVALCLAVAVFFTIIQGWRELFGYQSLPAPGQAAVRAISPLRTFNGYGLFRSMTLERPEIIIQGSMDGSAWEDYEFRWKPGKPGDLPQQVAPHQPRLDWQMWFAALSNARSNPWFINLCVRLLEGSEPVLALFEKDPFNGRPPRYIRALVYNYEFTAPEERAETGNWWKRTAGPELYLPPISLQRAE